MNQQEGVVVNSAVPAPAVSSPAPPNVQRISMPVLYVNQSTMKPGVSAPTSTSAGPTTIITAVPQIQLSGTGNPQIIHSAQNSNAYSYVPVRQVYQQAKSIKEVPQTHKKVLFTALNSNPNSKGNQVNLLVPNNQPMNTANKPMTSLILPNVTGVPNKTITGMVLSNNPAGANANKQTVTSLLLPNTKYPNIAPSKKVPIPNILIPQQNVSKQSNMQGIIRQTNAPNKNVVCFTPAASPGSNQMTSLLLAPNSSSNNKTPPTSVGLIIPTSAGQHGIIVPQSTAGPTHSILVPQSAAGQHHSILGAQPHSIIVPTSSGTQTHGIIVPSSSACTSQLTNVILSSSAANTPSTVASLLISNNSGGAAGMVPSSTHMTSLLIPQSVVSSVAAPSTNGSTQTTSILVPVSVGPNKSLLNPTNSLLQPCKKSNDKAVGMRDNKQSLLVKPGEGTLPSLPPLQPISNKEAGKTVLVKTPNGLNVPESLIMTPINEGEVVKNNTDKNNVDLTIELISVSTEERGTSTQSDDKGTSTDERHKEASGLTTKYGLPLRKKEAGFNMDVDVTLKLASKDDDKGVEDKPQSDDDVRIELVKPSKPKLPPPRYQKPEDLNPMEVLEWDQQGVGKLPGSNIKFRISEFGLDLVKEESFSNTPISSRRSSDDKPSEKPKEMLEEDTDKIYCCEGCACYGLYSEFLMDTRFCSVSCKKIVMERNDFKKKKALTEKYKDLRLRRRRRNIKIQAQRAAARKALLGSKEETKPKPSEEPESVTKAWTEKMAELRKKRNSKDVNIRINMSDEESRPAGTFRSDEEMSENNSRTPAASNVNSEDDNSSDKTATNSDNKEPSLVNSAGEFVWSYYLNRICNKARAAPEKLFKDPFPYGKHGFKVGMKLEGIDPEHQAIISVLTVAQLKGHRVRLHFDGFPDMYDFWVNSDSPDIFPPGWCERNNHSLDPPRGYTDDNFNWNTYLKQCRASPAPKSLFPKSNTPLCPSQFRVGMKLEAVDRKNSSLICVASVANLIDNRLLIHFDSWGDIYDYWTDPSSPYIHPIGWCEDNGYDLTPPNTYKNPSTFSWEAYLKETKSQAAPARAFKPRPPNMFKRGMKMEAIDKRAPSYLRPSTVREVKDYQIKIVFDGYPEEFGYWVDDDCPDIHPIGWGQKTGHPVTPPPLVQVKSECGTEGCNGEGNLRGGFFTKHTTAHLCPYATENLNRENPPDRFCTNPDFYEVPEPINKSKNNCNISIKDEDSSSESRVKTRNSLSSQREEEPKPKIDLEDKPEEKIERRGRKRKLPDAENRVEQLDKLRRELIQTVFDPGYRPAAGEQEMWVKHVATLGHRVNVTGGDPRCWNHKQVAAFVNTVIPSRAKLFLDQEIDGDAFLMLTQADLVKVLGLKLGPALKIYNCIILLRQKVVSL